MRKGRMELTEMDENSNEEPEISGGYLIEATGYASQDEVYGTSNKGIPYTYRYPERDDITEKQKDYIDNFFNNIENDAYNGIVDNIDKESFIHYIIVQELAANADDLWSNYMYKERNDDNLYFGPLWDFDESFGNDGRTLPIENFTNLIFKYGLSAGTMRDFVTKIFNNEEMLQSLKNYWKIFYESDIVEKVLEYIDEQVEIIKDSVKLNFIRWDILIRKIENGSQHARCTYEREIEYLKDYIIKRVEQLNLIIEKATVDSINEEVKTQRGPGQGGNHNGAGQPGGQPGQGGHHGGGHGSMGQIDETCLEVINE